MTDQRWAIYYLVDPRGDEIRYVGKTSKPPVRLRGHIRRAQARDPITGAWYCTRHVSNWIRQLLTHNLVPLQRVIEWHSQDKINDAERKHIRELRAAGINLTNATMGGDGGYFFPPLTPERYREIGQRIRETMLTRYTFEQRSEQARQRQLSIPPQQRSANARRGVATRKAKETPESRRAAYERTNAPRTTRAKQRPDYDRRRAASEVAKAVAAGVLTSSDNCETCGQPKKKRRLIAYHYLGYTPQHWLNVRWLCFGCRLKISDEQTTAHRTAAQRRKTTTVEQRQRAAQRRQMTLRARYTATERFELAQRIWATRRKNELARHERAR